MLKFFGKGLERFKIAQDETHFYALKELRNGKKETHWMWWELPQPRGLGFSPYSDFYGLFDLNEAKLYMADPELRDRYRELLSTVLADPGDDDPERIFGVIDAKKFHSSLTMFRLAGVEMKEIDDALNRFYGGELDADVIARMR